MSNCNPLKTPISPNEKFMKAPDDNEPEDPEDESTYRSLFGSSLFLGKHTRPDILFRVNGLSNFTEKPTKAHMQAHMLRESCDIYVGHRTWK